MTYVTKEKFEQLFNFQYQGDYLVNMLSQMNKEQLVSSCKLYNIIGISKLNKQQLIDKIANEMIVYIDNQLMYMTIDQFMFLDACLNVKSDIYTKLFEDNIDFFLERCLIFPCIKDRKPTILIPIEIRHYFDSMDLKRFEQYSLDNDLIIKYAKAMTNLYGAIDYITFIQKLNQFTNQHFELPRVLKLFDIQTGHIDNLHFNYITFLTIDDIMCDIIREQEKRINLDYYPYDKETTLKAANNDYIEDNPYLSEFMNGIQKQFKLSQRAVKNLAIDTMNFIKFNKSFNEMAQMMADSIQPESMSDMNIALNHLQQFYNHTKQWALKGYSPYELSGKDKPQVKNLKVEKVGRNELCPCGSGKKYKKCCLNN